MLGNFSQILAQYALLIPAFLLVLSVHESAHALIALVLGDDTAKKQGRITLNPLAHIDPLGLLCLLIFRVGWAKPVMFDQRNFKYPRLYSVLTALAGPLSNFVLAFVLLLSLNHLPIQYLPAGVTITLVQLLQITASLSVMLGVFNLMPIPPLDGSHILMVLFLYKYPRVLLWFYRYSIFIILALFFIPTTRIAFISLIQWVEMIIQSLVF